MAKAVGQNSAGGRKRGTTGTAIEELVDIQSADGEWQEGFGAQNQPEGKID